jgi:hypothetical protein
MNTETRVHAIYPPAVPNLNETYIRLTTFNKTRKIQNFMKIDWPVLGLLLNDRRQKRLMNMALARTTDIDKNDSSRACQKVARSQYSEGPAIGHLDTGFSWFPCA